MQRFLSIFLIGLGGLFTTDAFAQRSIAVAQAVSATQQAARLYGHSVDLGGAGLLPGAEAFPGAAPRGAMAGWPGSRWALLTTDTLIGDSTIAVALSPFTLRPDLRHDAAAGFRERLAGTTFVDGAPHAIFLGTDNAGTSGYAMLLRFDPDRPGGFGPLRLRWPIAGPPVAAALVGAPPILHVLYQGVDGPAVVSGPLTTPELPAHTHTLPVPDGAAGLEAAGLARSADGQLWATSQGFSFAQASGAPSSWVYTLASENGASTSEALELPGTAAGDTPLMPLAGGCLWAATEARAPGFYYATQICFDTGVQQKQVSYPLRIGDGGFRMALHPDGTVAVAAGNRMEIWPGGRREQRSREFREPVLDLEWAGDVLLLSEGNRVHLVDTRTLDTVSRTPVPGGRVVDLYPVAAPLTLNDADGDGLDVAAEARLALDPKNPDTDGDGLHDGIDPNRGPTSRLVLPDAVLFSGDAVGNELRTVNIDPGVSGPVAWRVRDEHDSAPWLRVYPNMGSGAGLLHLGVDPELYDGSALLGALTVTLDGAGPESHAVGSPRTLRIGVRAARGGVRRVLWLWGAPGGALRSPGDPRGFAALADQLAAAPFYFSHDDHDSTAPGGLDAYGVVVLSETAASLGVIAPSDLLEYVAAGGALLLLGTGRDDPAGGIARLLAPAGLAMVDGAPVSGSYDLKPETPLGVSVPELQFAGGRGLSGPEDFILTQGRENGGAVAVRDYGQGRIAVLAAPTPLKGRALGTPSNRRFADALFRWLARAGTRIADDDGDGLPDALESSYGTDQANPDSDGDGVPDGMEDRNRNGVVDEGETDPRNLDSDGDGIFDGADPRPYPALGTPRILAVSVVEGPLEGGSELVVAGRNLLHDARYRIGEAAAEVVSADGFSTARIRVPEGDAPGPASVHVTGSNGEGALANGYTYMPRSVATLTIAPLPDITPIVRDRGYEGILRLRMAVDTQATVSRVILRLRPTGIPGFRWAGARPAPDLSRRGMDVIGRLRSDGSFELIVNPPGDQPLPAGDLVWLAWELGADEWPGAPIRVEAMPHPANDQPLVVVLNPQGALLDGRLEPLRFMPDGNPLPPLSPTREPAAEAVNTPAAPGV